jgi:Putative metallopeptidase
MKTMADRACRLLFVPLLLAAAAPRLAAQEGFRVEYGEARDRESQQVRRYFEEHRVFDLLLRGLNGWVRMPRPIALRATGCAGGEVRWVPEQASVEVCYSLLPQLSDLLENEESALAPSFYFFVMHGAAHAIVDELELPAPDGEEQVADEVLALMLVPQGRMGTELLVGVRTLQGAAGWEQWEHPQAHGLTPDRIESIACVAYGANPARLAAYPESGLVPAARAEECEAAYRRVYSALGERLPRP